MADEEKEVKELQAMISSDGNSMRESGITHAKYMKWAVGEERREIGKGVRTEVDNWKRQRQQQLEAHKAYGIALKNSMRDQIARDKAVIEEHKERNLAQGKAVKAEVAALKQAKAMSKAQWEFRGRQLAKKDLEQREKIKQVRGEGSKTLVELSAKVKAEAQGLEEAIVTKKREILEANRREVAEIKKQTDDHVTDASKKIFYEQRKQIAENTRLAEEAWISERNQVGAAERAAMAAESWPSLGGRSPLPPALRPRGRHFAPSPLRAVLPLPPLHFTTTRAPLRTIAHPLRAHGRTEKRRLHREGEGQQGGGRGGAR